MRLARLNLCLGELPLLIYIHFLLTRETFEKEVIWVWENKGFSEEIKLRLKRFVKRFSVTILYLVDLFGTINRVTSHEFVVAAILVYSFIFFPSFFY